MYYINLNIKKKKRVLFKMFWNAKTYQTEDYIIKCNLQL